MKYKLAFVLILAMAMLINAIVGAGGNQTGSLYLNENDADLPSWDKGDSWTYKVTIDGGLDEFGFRNIKLTNLKFTLDEIQEEKYKLDVTSDIIGSMDLTSSIYVTLIDTQLQGTAYVDISTLSLEKIDEIYIGGRIKVNNLPGSIPFGATGLFNITYGGEDLPINFPINIDDSWDVDIIIIEVSITHGISGLGIPDPIELSFFIEDHHANCIGWDVVKIVDTNYDALKIDSDLADQHDIWYSPAAGNVIKVVTRNMPASWGGWGYYDLDMELISTTYQAISNPPETPVAPYGPTTLDVGVSGDYSTASNDPDGDDIRYVFDWGDGTETTSDFIMSGRPVLASNSWNKKGDYEVKVKARDKYGQQSSWSEALAVSILNDAPDKPTTPNGPTNGKIKTTYTYTTVSNDPNGHKIKYNFDWGDGTNSWTELLTSGETASNSHTWTRSGSYEIKVQAVDEYGEESEWSDPLPASMPTNTGVPDILVRIIQKLIDIFPILEPILLPMIN